MSPSMQAVKQTKLSEKRRRSARVSKRSSVPIESIQRKQKSASHQAETERAPLLVRRTRIRDDVVVQIDHLIALADRDENGSGELLPVDRLVDGDVLREVDGSEVAHGGLVCRSHLDDLCAKIRQADRAAGHIRNPVEIPFRALDERAPRTHAVIREPDAAGELESAATSAKV